MLKSARPGWLAEDPTPMRRLLALALALAPLALALATGAAVATMACHPAIPSQRRSTRCVLFGACWGDRHVACGSHPSTSHVLLQPKAHKPKGVQGLIEVENPNYRKPQRVKAKDVDTNAKVQLSRRERCVGCHAPCPVVGCASCWSVFSSPQRGARPSSCRTSLRQAACPGQDGANRVLCWLEPRHSAERDGVCWIQEQARTDMARLAEVRARREAATKRREQEELGG